MKNTFFILFFICRRDAASQPGENIFSTHSGVSFCCSKGPEQKHPLPDIFRFCKTVLFKSVSLVVFTMRRSIHRFSINRPRPDHGFCIFREVQNAKSSCRTFALRLHFPGRLYYGTQIKKICAANATH
ncbi:MAG: hypothetical protein IJ333_03260 [Clostridia bacterium]|nr:hypothetical protein [Clostridia bacterium]